MVCIQFLCAMMMSAFVVTSVLNICDSAVVPAKYSSSFYVLPILRNQPNWCTYEGERIGMGTFRPTPCLTCTCEPGGRFGCDSNPCPYMYHNCVEPYAPCCPPCSADYICSAPDGNYKEKYYMNGNVVCRCFGRERNDTIVCEPVHQTTNVAPVVG